MKFGEVPVAEAGRRDPGAQPAARQRGAEERPGAVAGGCRADRRLGDRPYRRGPARSRRHPRGRGGEPHRRRRRRGWYRDRDRLHRPGQFVRRGEGSPRLRPRPARPAQSGRRGGDPRDPAALCGGRAAPDGRDGQDHPVRGAGIGGRGRHRLRRGRREAAARRRVCAAPGRADPDPAARASRKAFSTRPAR